MAFWKAGQVPMWLPGLHVHSSLGLPALLPRESSEPCENGDTCAHVADGKAFTFAEWPCC
jgi:hypothetical protein